MSNSGEKLVVIADDDTDIVGALGRIVRSLGHKTLIAHDGLEALALLRETRVDLLLSDIDMPRMDGVALAATVRAEQLAPVRILLTGNARLDTAIEAINTGEIHRYIQKPWKHQELVAILEEAFARIDDLRRMDAASLAAQRLAAACAALEAEYPGITKREHGEDPYQIDRTRCAEALEALEGTTLAALVQAATKR